MAKPTQPTVSGRWVYTTNNQKLVGADKVTRVRIAAATPSLPRRETRTPKPPRRDV